MSRYLVAILLAIASPAAAQLATVPLMQTPSTVSPMPTQPNFGNLPAPSRPSYGANPPSGSSGGTRAMTRRNGRTVHVPANRPDRNNFSDRIENCIHAGSAAGIGPNGLGQFSAQCAN